MTVAPFAPEFPGLLTVAVYLRPARRAEAIATLIDLGMFVREYQAPRAIRPLLDAADLLVVFADDQNDHLRFVEELVDAGQLVTVVLPEGARAGPFERTGAFAVIREAAELQSLRRTFGDAGQIARHRRTQPPRDKGLATCVFGSLEFRPNEPWLARDGNLAGLSPTEHGVLRALVTAQGAVVPKEQLQRQLSGSSDLASDGYLKTVVLRLRRKVEHLGGDPARLSAVRGAGYVLHG